MEKNTRQTSPDFEALEQRLLLSTVTWDGGGDGVSWNDPLNWDADQLPGDSGTDDDVVVDIDGASSIVVSGADASFASLVIDSPLTITGVTLSAAGDIALDGATISISADSTLAISADLDITGSGSVKFLSGSAATAVMSLGEDVELATAESVNFSGSYMRVDSLANSQWTMSGTLSGQNIAIAPDMVNDGYMDIYNSTANSLAGSLTINAEASMRLRAQTHYDNSSNSCTLSVAGDLDNFGTITMDETIYSSSYASYVRLNVTDGVLTNHSGGVISTTDSYNRSHRYINASVVNAGVLSISAKTYMDVSGAVYSNSGDINLTGDGLWIRNFSTFDNSGTVDATGGSFVFQDFVSLTNSGSILTPGTALTISGFTSLDNTGLISVGGGNFAVSGYTQFNNSGDIEMADGRSFTVSGGEFNQTGDGLRGPSLNFSSATLNIIGLWTLDTGDALGLVSVTVDGSAGELRNDGRINAKNVVFDIAALNNAGYMDFYDTTGNYVNGSFANLAGSTLRLRAQTHYSSTYANCRVTFASGFVNSGVIELTETIYSSSYSSYVHLVVSEGELLNAVGGEIIASDQYNRGHRYLDTSLSNEGVINISAKTYMDIADAVYNNSGDINLTDAGLWIRNFSTFDNSGTINTSGGTFVFQDFTSLTNSGSILAPGTALTISGFTTLDNTGLISVGGGNFAVSGYTQFNNSGDIEMADGRSFSVSGGEFNQTGDGLRGTSLGFTSAALNIIGLWTLDTGDVLGLNTVTVAGDTGELRNEGRINARHVIFDIATLNNAGYMDFYDTTSNQINGYFANLAGSTLRLRAQTHYSSTYSNCRVTFASGFVNSGVIELTETIYSTNYSSYVYLMVSEGELLNAAGGEIIATDQYNRSHRYLDTSLSNEGVINISAKTYMDIAGATYSNSGDINLTGDGLWIRNFASFDNSGTINATGGSLTFQTFDTLTNSGSILTPGTALTISGFTTLDNTGLISVGGGNFDISSYTQFNNSGDIEIADGRSFSVSGGEFNQTGDGLRGTSLGFTSATLNITGLWTLDTGDVLGLNSVTVDGSEGELRNEGRINARNAVFNIATLNNAGYMDFYDTTGNYVNGSYANLAGSTLRLRAQTHYSSTYANCRVSFASGFVNTGVIELTETIYSSSYSSYVRLDISDGELLNAAGGEIIAADQYGRGYRYLDCSLINEGYLNIGADSYISTAAEIFNNTGRVSVESGERLELKAVALPNIQDGELVGGRWELEGTVAVDSALLTVNAADLVVIGNGSKIVNLSNANLLSALASNSDGASLEVRDGSLALNSTLVNQGTILLTNGVLSVPGVLYPGGLINEAAGVLTGTGSVSGDLVNNGLLEPDGSLAISGNMTLSGGVVELDVRGMASGEFDVILAGAAATLGGELRVVLDESYTPLFGDVLDVMTFASYTDDFDLYSGMECPNLLAFRPVFDSGAGKMSLRVGVAQPGDSPTAAVNPAPGYHASDIDSLTIYLSEVLAGETARNASNYELRLLDDDTVIDTVVGYVDGELLITLALGDVLADGTYRLTVRSGETGLKDLDGNSLDGDANTIGGDDLVMQFVIDRQAPVISQVTLNSDSLQVAFDDYSDMDAESIIAGNFEIFASGGDGTFGDGNEIDISSLIASVSFGQLGQMAEITFSEILPDEIYSIVISGAVVDMVGNALGSGAGHTAQAELLTAPAQVSVALKADSDSGTPGDWITASTSVTLLVTVDRSGLISLDSDGDGVVDAELWVVGGGEYEFPVSYSADGEYQIEVDFVPAAGEPVADTATIVIDTTSPTVADDGSGGYDVVAGNSAITVRFADAVGMDATTLTPQAFSLVASGGDGEFGDGDDLDISTRITSVSFDSASGIATLNISGALAGEYYRLVINADGSMADLAGNALEPAGELVHEFNFQGDEASLQISLGAGQDSGVSASDGVSNISRPQIAVNVDRPGEISLDFDNDGLSDTIFTAAAGGDYVFDFPAALADLSDGSNTIAAVFTPLLGDEVTANLDITVDTQSPQWLSVTPSGLVTNYLSSFTISFDSGVFLPGDVISHVAVSDPSGGAVAVTSVTMAGENAVVVNFAAQSGGGIYTLAIDAVLTDQAGNLLASAVNSSAELRLADLAASQLVLADSDVNFGRPLDISWVVANTGDIAATGMWIDRVYLSQDDQFNVYSDMLLGSVSRDGDLDSGSQYTGATTVTLPVSEYLPDGQWTLFVVSDAADSVDEYDSANNITAATLNITRTAGPTISAMTVVTDDLSGVVSALNISFDMPIDTASFSAGDIAINGPGGQIGVSDIEMLDTANYRLVLNTPDTPGAYTIAIGPNVSDQWGNRMDGNGDGVNGDAWTGGFDIAMADLSVSQVATNQTQISPATQLDISYTVENIGDLPAIGYFAAQIWLSNDMQPGGGDLLLNYSLSNQDVLAATGQREIAMTVDIPVDLALTDGQWYVIVQLNSGGEVLEYNAANNIASSAAVELVHLPGAAVESLTPVYAADGALVAVDIQFDMPIDPGSFSVGDVSLTGAVISPVILSVADLGGHLWRVSFTTPATDGDYTLSVGPDINDLLGGVMDGNGDGTAGDAFVTVIEFSPADLHLSAPALADADFGQYIDLAWQVLNDSSLTAAPAAWTDAVYLSSDANLSVSEDIYLGSYQHSALAASGVSDAALRVSLPLSHELPAGEYFIIISADTGHSVYETDYSDNTIALAITLDYPELPNLQVSDIAIVASDETGYIIEQGGTVTLGWTLANTGDADATGPWSQNLWLSSDAAAGDDEFLVSFVYDGLIAAGSQVEITQSFDMPSTISFGQMWFVVQADSGEVVFESDESDNTSVSAESALLNPSLEVSVNRSSIIEGSDDYLTFTVTRNGLLDSPLTVFISVLGSDGQVDASELSAPATLVIPAGQHTAAFNVSALSDGIVDGDVYTAVMFEADAWDDDPYNTNTDGDYIGLPLSGSVNIAVLDSDEYSISLSLDADQVLESGSVTATVTLNPAPLLDTPLNLLFGTTTQFEPLGDLVVPAGQSTLIVELVPVDDNMAEQLRDLTIKVSASLYGSATAPLALLDNDFVALTLTLDSDMVSETFGSAIVMGTVTLASAYDRDLSVVLSSDSPERLSVLEYIVIPAGELSAAFAVSAIDDQLVNGSALVTIEAVATDVFTGSLLAGSVASATLTVLDNDGPRLVLDAEVGTLAEGASAEVTITRETLDTSADLTVTLDLSTQGQLNAPTSLVIPAGQSQVSFTVTGVVDGIGDGSQYITIAASAGGLDSGLLTLCVSDIDKPDLAAGDITLPTAGYTDSMLPVSWRIANEGLSDFSGQWTERVYFSRDGSLDGAIYLGTHEYIGDLPMGAAIVRSTSVRVPDVTGQWRVIVVVDSGDSAEEISQRNNTLVSETSVEISPAYTVADLQVSPAISTGGQPVSISGRLDMASTGLPAAYMPVVIEILHGWSRREYRVVADQAGNFELSFYPLEGEAGQYELRASHPAEGAEASEDSFILLGMYSEVDTVKHTALSDETITGEIVINNMSPVALNGLMVESVYAPDGLDISLEMSEITLAADGQAVLSYSVSNAGTATGRFGWYARVYSAQGVELFIVMDCTFNAPAAQLSAVSSISGGMIRGKRSVYEFDITNTGSAATGQLTVNLPDAPWILSNTPVIESLEPGETATVSLTLAPAADLDFGFYEGNITVSGENVGVSVDFEFRCVSESVGSVEFSVVNERTYNGDGAGLAGAAVALYDPYTGLAVARGVTGSDGTLLLEDVPEGRWNYEVSFDGHDTVRKSLMVTPGGELEQLVFLHTQFVRFEWVVEEIEIQDTYEIKLNTVYEVNVPAPVVTITPSVIDLSKLTDEVTQIDFVIENHGLIAAQDFTLFFGEHPNWEITALVDRISTLAAHTKLTIPVFFRQVTDGGDDPQAASEAQQSSQQASTMFAEASGIQSEDCEVPAAAGYWYICGPFNVMIPIPIGLLNPSDDCVEDDDDDGDDGNDSETGPGGETPPPPPPGVPGGGWEKIINPITFGGGSGTSFDSGTPVWTGGGGGGGWDEEEDCVCDKDNFEEQTVSADIGFKTGELFNTFVDALNGALHLTMPYLTVGAGLEVNLSGSASTCCEDGYAGLKTKLSPHAKVSGTLFVGKTVSITHLGATIGGVGGELTLTAKGGVEFGLSGSAGATYESDCHLANQRWSVNGAVQLSGQPLVSLEGSFSAGGQTWGVSGQAYAQSGLTYTYDFRQSMSNPRVKLTFDGVKLGLDLSINWGDTYSKWSYGYQWIAPFDLADVPAAGAELTETMDAETLAIMCGYASAAEMYSSFSGGVAPVSAWESGGSLDDFDENMNTAYEMAAAAADGRIFYGSSLIEGDEYRAAADEESGSCAQVAMQIDQQAVLTRSIFAGTLGISNSSPALSMDDIEIHLDIRDADGNPALDKFNIIEPVLTGIEQLTDGVKPDDWDSSVDGPWFGQTTYTLPADSTGKIRWTIIPKTEAAETTSQRYSIGGIYSYSMDELVSSGILSPVIITVSPSPQLDLKYFLQRDVIADDPYTEQIEASLPFVMAVMVSNSGAGMANDFSIDTAQPKIVENAKGLEIDFSILAAEVDGMPVSTGLTATFGDIAAGDTSTAIWLMNTTLQGHFIEYDASFTHVSQFGDLLPSLIDSVDIFELIHVVNADGEFEDYLDDFLTNDLPDPGYRPVPDTLHLSDGTTMPVANATVGDVSAAMDDDQLVIDIAVENGNGSGWNYLTLNDPGMGDYRPVEVIRLNDLGEDIGRVDASSNIWQSDRSFAEAHERPVYEDMLHLLDYGDAAGYRVICEPVDNEAPVVTGIQLVRSQEDEAVEAALVSFSEPLRDGIFDASDLILTRNGQTLAVDTVSVVRVDDLLYRIDMPADLIADSGNYELAIDMTRISDVYGNIATGIAETNWLNPGQGPTVLSLSDTPEAFVKATPNGLYVHFSEDVEIGSFDSNDLAMTMNGQSVDTSALEVTRLSARSYRLSGLSVLASEQGDYELTIDASGVNDTEGNSGAGLTKTAWTVDTTAPKLVDVSGLPASMTNEAVESILINFDEMLPDSGININTDIEITLNGVPVDTSALTSTHAKTSISVNVLSISTQAEGDYNLKINLSNTSDLAGNFAEGIFEYQWTCDRSAPEKPQAISIAPDTGEFDDDMLSNTAVIVLSGTLSEDNLSVEITDTSRNYSPGIAIVQGSSFTASLNLLSNGAHELAITVSDFAGNSITEYIEVFVDTVAPAVTSFDNRPAAITRHNVDYLDVIFSEPVDQSLLGADIVSLTRDGGANLISSWSQLEFVSDSVLRISGLNDITAIPGDYILSFDPAGLLDSAGNTGVADRVLTWYRSPDVTAPRVENIVIQDGLQQRHTVDGFAVVFDEDMALSAPIANGTIVAAIEIINLGVNADADADTAVGLTTAQFSYDTDSHSLIWNSAGCTPCGGGSEGLDDGFYRVILHSALITDIVGWSLDGDLDGLPGGDYAFEFFRLSGDANGDMIVDDADSAILEAAFGTAAGEDGFDAGADLDGDGVITQADRELMAVSMGGQIVPPDVTAPVIVDVEISGGITQRSDVRSFAIRFSEAVNAAELISTGAITASVTLLNLGMDADLDSDSAVVITADQFSYDSETFTLYWQADESLTDGVYSLRINRNALTDLVGNRLISSDTEFFSGESFYSVAPFENSSASPLQTTGYSVPSFADLDGDGLTDLIVGEKIGLTGKIRWYRNTGTAAEPIFDSFTYITTGGSDFVVNASGCLGAAPALADLNGDGLIDMAVGLADGTLLWLENTGGLPGDFAAAAPVATGPAAAPELLDVGARATVAATDWNNDGLADLVIGALDGTMRVLINTTRDDALEFGRIVTPRTVDGTSIISTLGRSSAALADFDGDGRKDLLLGVTAGTLELYLNAGTDANPIFDAAIPIVDTADQEISLAVSRSRPTAADIDGDGDIEILVGGSDGSLTLLDPAGSVADAHSGLEFLFHRLSGDINGDAVVDMTDNTLVLDSLGSRPGDINWDPDADADSSGVITTRDRLRVHLALDNEVIYPSATNDDPEDPDPSFVEADGDLIDDPAGAYSLQLLTAGGEPAVYTSLVNASFSSDTDGDWFMLAAPSSGTLVFSTACAQGDLDLQLFSSESGLSALQPLDEGLSQLTVSVVVGRYYYLRATPATATTPGDYTDAPYQLGLSLSSYDDYVTMLGVDRLIADTDLDGSGYSVAVLDTGVDYTHPALAGRVIAGPDFGSGDADPMDTVGHGSHVAGIIVSGDDQAPGIASGAQVIAVKITPDGSMTAETQAIIDGLQWVLDNHLSYNIAAVNLSFATGSVPDDQVIDDINDLYRQLYEAGIFIAVAAGNDYYANQSDGISELATGPYVASVSAVWDSNAGSGVWAGGARDYSSDTDRVAAFSQRSADLDLMAPGADILNVCSCGGLGVRSGTSMAAPMVAATAVLMKQAADACGTNIDPATILQLMKGSAEKIFDGDDEDDNVLNSSRQYDRLDSYDAIAAVQSWCSGSQTLLGDEIAAIAGDADGDGLVDLNDFIALKSNYGTTGSATWSMGDFNGDSTVDLLDFIILKQNYGA